MTVTRRAGIIAQGLEGAVDHEDMVERAAVYEFEGELPRETAEILAGLRPNPDQITFEKLFGGCDD